MKYSMYLNGYSHIEYPLLAVVLGFGSNMFRQNLAVFPLDNLIFLF